MNPKVTRRRFIKGVIFSATTATAGIYIENAASSRPSGAVERLVSLSVNGRTRRVDVLPQETLAHNQYNVPMIDNLVERAIVAG